MKLAITYADVKLILNNEDTYCIVHHDKRIIIRDEIAYSIKENPRLLEYFKRGRIEMEEFSAVYNMGFKAGLRAGTEKAINNLKDVLGA